MDLIDRKRNDLAWRFLNRYLEETGDYGGIAVLRFYIVYRALVRAKVHLMRAFQPHVSATEKRRLIDCFRVYLRLAERSASGAPNGLVIAHGLSGSGKTTATQSLIELLGAVRLRSDLERKRMHGVLPLAVTQSAPGAGIYSRRASTATYRRLARLAADVIGAGYPAVVDAAFLKRTEREAFRVLAEQLEIPFVILDFRAPVTLLRQRVAQRRARADDASEADLAVLERQIVDCEPLTPAEMEWVIVADATGPPSKKKWRHVLRLLHGKASAKQARPFA
jgi:predicted kinase